MINKGYEKKKKKNLCKFSMRLEKLNCYERIGSWLAGVRQVLDVHRKFLSTREA